MSERDNTDTDTSPIRLSLTEGENGTEGAPHTEGKGSGRPVTVTSHLSSHATVLIVGPSGTGKTTFLRTLENVHYKSDGKVSSQTLAAYSNDRLFNIAGEYCFLQFIDTPGFGDTEGRSNLELENLILKFVKSDVTKLNMVMVTVPFGRRIDEGQARNVLECLNFLGPELR